jgi:hypothetical protein
VKLTGTIDLIELLWTFVAIAGLALAVDLLEQARYDRRVVRSARPVAASAERRAARERERARAWELECEIVTGDVASAWWIVCQEVVSLAIGVVALATPSPPGGRTIFGWVVVAGLLVFAAVIPMRLYGQRRRRRRLGVSSDRSRG